MRGRRKGPRRNLSPPRGWDATPRRAASGHQVPFLNAQQSGFSIFGLDRENGGPQNGQIQRRPAGARGGQRANPASAPLPSPSRFDARTVASPPTTSRARARPGRCASPAVAARRCLSLTPASVSLSPSFRPASSSVSASARVRSLARRGVRATTGGPMIPMIRHAPTS